MPGQLPAGPPPMMGGPQGPGPQGPGPMPGRIQIPQRGQPGPGLMDRIPPGVVGPQGPPPQMNSIQPPGMMPNRGGGFDPTGGGMGPDPGRQAMLQRILQNRAMQQQQGGRMY